MTKSLNFIIIFLSINSEILDLSASSLKLVQIVQRHGDRTPTNFYPNDPYKNESFWPDGIGELTRRGKTRMFEFGISIRNKYNDYLGVSPKEISVRSSSATRTLESAQCFVAGLYKPYEYWIWNNSSDIESSAIAQYWQPIPIDTVSATSDGLLRTTATCPKADSIWQEFMQSDQVRSYLSNKKEFIEELSNRTGDEYWSVFPSPLRPLEFLSTTLRVERENDLKMPEWAVNETLEKLRGLELHAFYFDWKDPQIQRLRAGLLLKELSDNMIKRVNENISENNMKKLYLYETHDVSQVVLMQALNVYDQVNRTPPTYAASMVFELHQIDQQFLVKLIYFNDVGIANTSIDNFIELKLINCDPNYNCTLDKFIDSIQDLIPSDWEKECGLTSTEQNVLFNLFSLVYLFGGIALGFVCMGIITTICYKIKKSHSNEEVNSFSQIVSRTKKYTE